MKTRGRVSPTKAARIVGVHRNTIYAHCRRAFDGRPTLLEDVDRDPVNGYLSISLASLEPLRRRGSLL